MQPRALPSHRCCAVLAMALLAAAAQACATPSTDVASQQAAQAQPEKPSTPQPVRTLTVSNRPARGAATARVTLIEYSDYGCSYCAQYFADVYPRLIREYVDTGKLRYVFKNYPSEQLHPGVTKAHVAAACAGDQGRYWEMHDRLFADQGGFDEPSLLERARAVGLDAGAFRSCLDGTAHDALIREDIDEAVRGGVGGTPVFAVALTGPEGAAVTPLRVVVGAQPYQVFRTAIDAVLERVGASDGPES